MAGNRHNTFPVLPRKCSVTVYSDLAIKFTFGEIYSRDTVCCTEFERPTLEGVFLKTLVSRWARSFRLQRKERKNSYSTVAPHKHSVIR